MQISTPAYVKIVFFMARNCHEVDEVSVYCSMFVPEVKLVFKTYFKCQISTTYYMYITRNIQASA